MGWPFDGLIEKVYLPHFQSNGEDGLPFLCESSVARMALLSKYKTLEPMTEKERQELLQYVNERFPGQTDEQKEGSIKIIHTIGTLAPDKDQVGTSESPQL